MISEMEATYLKRTAFRLFNEIPKIHIMPSIEYGVYAFYKDKECWLGAENETFFLRGLTLLMKNLKNGNHCFEIYQIPYFPSCGVLMPENLSFENIKEHINLLACLGINLILLPICMKSEGEGYPCEMFRNLFSYAAKFGIECAPHFHVYSTGSSGVLLSAMKHFPGCKKISLQFADNDRKGHKKLSESLRNNGLTPMFYCKCANSPYSYPIISNGTPPCHTEEEENHPKFFSTEDSSSDLWNAMCTTLHSFCDEDCEAIAIPYGVHTAYPAPDWLLPLAILSEFCYRGKSSSLADALSMRDYIVRHAPKLFEPAPQNRVPYSEHIVSI